ncbi:hypothetical protein pb186bvf_003401 [Paramecium bursaria]
MLQHLFRYFIQFNWDEAITKYPPSQCGIKQYSRDSILLNLSNNPLNVQTQQQLARAISKSGVQKLLVDNIIIDESFINILNSNHLEYLSMQHCRLKEVNKMFDRNQKLKYVNLSENFNLEIPLLKIETMVLDRCFYENVQLFQLFKQLYKNQGVKHLSIRDTFLTPELQQLIDDALNNNKQLQSLDCSCELIIQIKRKLKINNREHLQLQLNSFQIFDCQKEFQTLDVLTEKIRSKKFLLLEDLEQNISMVPSYSLSQSQQTQKLQNQLSQLKEYDSSLTFTMNDIEKKKNSLIYQSELDVVFFQNNLVKLRKETENFKIMQQNIAQKHKQYKEKIVQLQSHDQSASFQLRKAQQIYNELLQTYNVEKEKQQLLQEQIRLQQLQDTLKKQKRPKSRSKSKN